MTGMMLGGIPYVAKGLLSGNRSKIDGVQLGVITYSYRSMDDQSAEATLQYVLDSGLGAIELMGDPAESFAGAPQSTVDRRAIWGLRRKNRDGSITDNEKKDLSEMQVAAEAYAREMAVWRSEVGPDKFEELRMMYSDAGVEIYGYKPRAFQKNSTAGEVAYGFRMAKALGASHITLEHPSDDEHTAFLGNVARGYGIGVGYHGHEQQTPTFWDTALGQSPHNGLNIDIGHYVAAGNRDTMDIIKRKHSRIMSMHVKDRQTPSNGKGNLLWGTGDTPIEKVLTMMRDMKYSFPATVELEYKIPEGSNAVKEVKRCVDFCRNILEG